LSDQELAALAAATKSLLDSHNLTARAEMAALRASVEALETELREVRATVKVLPGEVHASAASMVQTLGANLGNALPEAVRAAAERHFMKMALARGMAIEGTAS
jgi:hypothetical protein